MLMTLKMEKPAISTTTTQLPFLLLLLSICCCCGSAQLGNLVPAEAYLVSSDHLNVPVTLPIGDFYLVREQDLIPVRMGSPSAHSLAAEEEEEEMEGGGGGMGWNEPAQSSPSNFATLQSPRQLSPGQQQQQQQPGSDDYLNLDDLDESFFLDDNIQPVHTLQGIQQPGLPAHQAAYSPHGFSPRQQQQQQQQSPRFSPSSRQTGQPFQYQQQQQLSPNVPPASASAAAHSPLAFAQPESGVQSYRQQQQQQPRYTEDEIELMRSMGLWEDADGGGGAAA
mgnify:CR=1 FL=1